MRRCTCHARLVHTALVFKARVGRMPMRISNEGLRTPVDDCWLEPTCRSAFVLAQAKD
jgi:hypothetical protein